MVEIKDAAPSNAEHVGRELAQQVPLISAMEGTEVVCSKTEWDILHIIDRMGMARDGMQGRHT